MPLVCGGLCNVPLNYGVLIQGPTHFGVLVYFVLLQSGVTSVRFGPISGGLISIFTLATVYI